MKKFKSILAALMIGIMVGSTVFSAAAYATETDASESGSKTVEGKTLDNQAEENESQVPGNETGEGESKVPESAGETGEGQAVESEAQTENDDSEESEAIENAPEETPENFIPEEANDDPEYLINQQKNAANGTEDGPYIENEAPITPYALQETPKIKAYGVDVSAWQKEIDWKKVKADGVEFAFIRVGYRGATEGGLFTDAYAIANIKGALAAGIEVGVYFFSTALNEEEAVEEAKYTLDIIKGYNITYPIVYDSEGYFMEGYRDYKLDKTQRTNNALAFLDYVQSRGYTGMMYSSSSHMENDSQWEISRIDPKYPVWVAQYFLRPVTVIEIEDGEEVEKTVYEGYPSFESLEGKQTSYSGDYKIWQCSSNGQINGINGKADLDIEYYNTYEEVSAFVSRLYKLILGRNPDASGLDAWTMTLINQEEDAAGVVTGFVHSDEFKKMNLSDEEYVKILYRTCLDREADKSGLNAWLDCLKGKFSRDYVLRGFIESDEFTKICNSYDIIRGSIKLTENRDRNSSVTSFVRRCYNVFLDREPDVEGLNAWTGKILADKEQARKVPYGFVFSKEMEKKNLTAEQFVIMLYKGIMDREPDDIGLEEWVYQLEHGTSKAEVYNGFTYSKEFTELLAKYGL